MEVGLRESCFAENLLEQLHSAEAEAVETSPKSRRHCCRVDVQLRTTKANQLIISGTRFFGENLMTDLKPDGQKELKNGVFMLFPRFLAMPKF